MGREHLHEFPFGSGRESARFLSARRVDRKEGNEYVALMVYNNASYTGDLRVQLEVVDEEPINDQQDRDQEFLGSARRDPPSRALGGVRDLLRCGKATLGAESEPTLVETVVKVVIVTSSLGIDSPEVHCEDSVERHAEP